MTPFRNLVERRDNYGGEILKSWRRPAVKVVTTAKQYYLPPGG